jgi:CxxC motif-containing protein (DUF1111 family)
MIRAHVASITRFNRGPARLITGYLLVVACPLALGGPRDRRAEASTEDHHAGRELFVKVWEAGKKSPAGGDGLGPLYNETSCVACHRLGGIGGGGTNRQNVTLLTAETAVSRFGSTGEVFKGELEDLHFGFVNATGIVLHRHSTNPSEQRRLDQMKSFGSVKTSDRTFTLRTSSRNTPAVFGSGLIDQVPEEVLLAAQRRTFEKFPEICGRVSRLTDGRIGRFGWKGQTATLREFVMAACANELGLEVPRNHQGRLEAPRSFEAAAGPDLDEQQCNQLVEFVAGLAPPRLRPIVENKVEPWGYSVFDRVGCAACHTPELGAINGIYSDLLLHDLGESLGDIATYYGSPSSSGSSGDIAEARERARQTGAPAVATEWRTPPLWGVANSAPYLHDGRARTIREAIEQHGGEAAATVNRYSQLSRGDRIALFNFLHSLTVPTKGRRAAAIEAIQARSHQGVAADRENDPEGLEIRSNGESVAKGPG